MSDIVLVWNKHFTHGWPVGDMCCLLIHPIKLIDKDCKLELAILDQAINSSFCLRPASKILLSRALEHTAFFMTLLRQLQGLQGSKQELHDVHQALRVLNMCLAQLIGLCSCLLAHICHHPLLVLTQFSKACNVLEIIGAHEFLLLLGFRHLQESKALCPDMWLVPQHVNVFNEIVPFKLQLHITNLIAGDLDLGQPLPKGAIARGGTRRRLWA